MIAIMMLTLIIISVLLNLIVNYLIIKISTYCACNIRNNLFSKVLTLKINEFKNFPVSSLITRTNQDVEQIKSFIVSFLSTIFKGPILLISCITVLKTLNSSFLVLIIVSVIILLLFLAIMIYKLLPISKKIELSLDSLNKHLNEKISGYKLIKSYNNLELENNKFEKENENHLLLSKKIIKYSSFINPFLNLIVNSITIIILSMSLSLIKTNSMEAGTIIATIQYILQLLLSIVMISLLAINIPTIRISLNRIEEVCPEAFIFCCTLGYSAYSGYYYTEARRLEFNKIITELTLEHNAQIIDLSSVQTTETYNKYLGDSLHPNADGMVAYANEVVKVIKEYVGA
jgi:ATP-binding cassette subfamily B protein